MKDNNKQPIIDIIHIHNTDIILCSDETPLKPFDE